jgi:diguanylate cyclase (GGDEF)-like protein/PAS domain S-box-containing protein
MSKKTQPRLENPLVQRLVKSGKLEFLLQGVGIFLKDYSTGAGFANTFWKECGYTEADMTDSRLAEIVHPDDRAEVREAFTRLKSGKSDFYAGEYRIRDSKGEYRWVRHRSLVLERTDEGVPSLYMGSDVEITDLVERIETEKCEREEMERRYLEAETLRLAGAVVAAGIDPGQSIDRILAQSERVVPADAIVIWAVSEEGLECVGARGTEILPAISGDRMPRNFSWVLEEKRPRRNLSRPVSRGEIVYHDSLYIPVVARARVLGILEFLCKEARGLGHRAEGPASIFADSVAVALENALEFRQLDQEAGVDWLTSLPTRRRFDFQARAFLDNPSEARACSVFMIDLDKFKVLNDTYGHAAGDKALADAARVCRETLRATDLVCRYGGEEIAALLPGAAARAGSAVAERIRAGIEALRFDDYPGMRLTVSIGVCAMKAGGCDLSTLLAEADKALYQAKGEGRNRVILISSHP